MEFSTSSHSRCLCSQRQRDFLAHWQPSDGKSWFFHKQGKSVFGKWPLLEQLNERNNFQSLHKSVSLHLKNPRKQVINLSVSIYITYIRQYHTSQLKVKECLPAYGARIQNVLQSTGPISFYEQVHFPSQKIKLWLCP